MSWRKGGIAVAGLTVLFLAAAVGSGVTGGLLPVDRMVSLLGNDYLVVVGLAAIAFAFALPVLASGRSRRVVTAAMPDPERPVTMPAPGDDVDEAVAGWLTWLPLAGGRRERAVRTRIRTAAIDVVALEVGSREDAVRQVDAGTWTTDPVARTFVAGSMTGPSAGRPLRTILDGESGLARRVRRTVDAIEAYRNGHREVRHARRHAH